MSIDFVFIGSLATIIASIDLILIKKVSYEIIDDLFLFYENFVLNAFECIDDD